MSNFGENGLVQSAIMFGMASRMNMGGKYGKDHRRDCSMSEKKTWCPMTMNQEDYEHCIREHCEWWVKAWDWVTHDKPDKKDVSACAIKKIAERLH
jgi:hypothetical protein